jgi:hypothetical protein
MKLKDVFWPVRPVERPRRSADEVIGMGEVPRSTDEARAYAIALDWVNRRGANEASRLADLTVRNVQILSRGQS